jgi:leucine dehydrogenase
MGSDMVETAFEHPELNAHEQVVFCRHPQSGLSAIIAIHNTNLGPALGGCRIWPYADSYEALTDVLRLSKGMTYKNALAGLDFGGGKAVIMTGPRDQKTPDMIRAFGDHVGYLGGGYLTAKDVGITSADLETIRTRTPHVTGVGPHGAGDPSPYTAVGIFAGLKAALAHRFGSPDPAGRRVAIQGVGAVGFGLGKLLHEAGARLIVADLHAGHVDRAVTAFGAERIGTEEAHRADADVFAPCALGAVLNEGTIPEIGAPIVAGGANNQLATPEDARRLADRGILYAPDYVINAGGVISLAFPAGSDEARITSKLEAIGETLTAIFRRADAEGKTTAEVADRMAEERFRR